MIENIKNDIFAVTCDAIIHQANCMNTMGSGIARTVRELFPEAYEADCRTKKGDSLKLGTFSWAMVKNPDYPHIKAIINLYGQFNFSADSRHTRYDALYDGFVMVREKMRQKAKNDLRTLAIPFRLGCNRGGGDWRVVNAIIESVFVDEKHFKVLICENPALQEDLMNSQSK
jgi:O-acetyl-ADP-ribose deacetylase (regulator of RNase III)